MRTVEKLEKRFESLKEKAVQIGNSKLAIEARAKLMNEYTTGITTARVKEICNAEREGRCVMLPCPFYQEVYALSQCGGEIIHGEFRSLNKDYCLIVNLEGNLTSKGKTWSGIQVRKQDVFLTREAAEQAKERESSV